MGGLKQVLTRWDGGDGPALHCALKNWLQDKVIKLVSYLDVVFLLLCRQWHVQYADTPGAVVLLQLIDPTIEPGKLVVLGLQGQPEGLVFGFDVLHSSLHAVQLVELRHDAR